MNIFWTILIGSLIGINCSIVGCYLVLRKMSMMSDAISHSILPGIVISFIITKSKSTISMLIGAIIMGITATFLIEFLKKKIKIKTDASIGIVFTFLFSIGIILVSYFTNQIDLDQDCVLYGEISYVALDLWITESGINLGPKSIYLLTFILLFNLMFIKLSYKELFITTFDPEFSESIGIKTKNWHYILMIIVSITIVSSFESVGTILVISFIVIPAATSYIIVNKLEKMLIMSSIFSISSSILGYYFAVLINGSISGSISTISGIIFFIFFFMKTRKNKIKHKIN